MRRIITPIAMALLFFVFGAYVGYNRVPEIWKVTGLDNKENQIASAVNFAPFWKAWNILNDKFVPASATSTTAEDRNLFNQELVWGAIEGLASAVEDPYTIFLPPAQNEIFQSDINGNFEGVGMEISIRNDVLTVVAPLKQSPAERAGIRAGDKILEIDGKSTRGLSVDEAVRLIRGPEGSSVELTLLSTGDSQTSRVKVVRTRIEIPVLDTEMRKSAVGNVFIIRLYSFAGNSPNLFRSALQTFIDSRGDKLVLDLRGNPGGYLDAAVDMASWFLPEGKVIVREFYGEERDENVHRSRGYDIFNENLKMIILVDGGSASASEILAGALREHKKVPLVGKKTFGKGSVQELIEITGDTALKVTVARWLLPGGDSISEKGIEPDYVVEMTKEDIEKGRDPQMDKAIEVLDSR